MRGFDRLLRLAELRADLAERHFMAAQNELRKAEADIQRAEAAEHDLRIKMDRQREAVRESFVGSTHARVAVEELMLDMTGFDVAEEAAGQAVKDAIAARDAKIPPRDEARTQARAARATVDRRAEMLAQTQAEERRAAETRADAEAEEQWVGQRKFGVQA